MKVAVVLLLLCSVAFAEDHMMMSPSGGVYEVPARDVHVYEDRGFHLMTRDEKDAYYEKRAHDVGDTALREYNDEHDRRRNIALGVIGGLLLIPIGGSILYARKRKR